MEDDNYKQGWREGFSDAKARIGELIRNIESERGTALDGSKHLLLFQVGNLSNKI